MQKMIPLPIKSWNPLHQRNMRALLCGDSQADRLRSRIVDI